MGNVITDSGGTTRIKNTPLGKFIKDWAINNFVIHPDFQNQDLHKFTLKKRACCTNNTQPTIGVMDVNPDPKDNKMYQYAVGIPVFEDRSDIKRENCMLPYAGDKDDNFMYDSYDSNQVLSSKHTCADFYENRFCPMVRRNRSYYKLNLKDPKLSLAQMASLYGVNPDKARDNRVNAYVDCNCENSFFKSTLGTVQTNNRASPDQMAQTLDSRCNQNLDKAWRKSHNIINNLCINSINVQGGITADNGGQIAIQQQCSVSTSNGPSSPTQSPSPTQEPAPSSPTPAPQTFTQTLTMPPTQPPTMQPRQAPTEPPESEEPEDFVSKLRNIYKTNPTLVYGIIGAFIVLILLAVMFSGGSNNDYRRYRYDYDYE
jgi:hypothetical protein